MRSQNILKSAADKLGEKFNAIVKTPIFSKEVRFGLEFRYREFDIEITLSTQRGNISITIVGYSKITHKNCFLWLKHRRHQRWQGIALNEGQKHLAIIKEAVFNAMAIRQNKLPLSPVGLCT